ncbi:low temperature requirement protein A [Micromonospora parathelypteridis]|uniref:Low temperature requirement protein LtrA n=1 Tax=Micromonospora parathelypteridis TaxID=1839617 RepID=A0A840VHF3_9ACTN|nr:low temperature requirement protein A [Micromonospora parathelypteridis]MBB5476282.1 low temperature requirement protein LtrA [Micromonospora parathelypteridis]GGO14347.1 membrane protein [Micromonospora parathelypteridis]
MGSRAAGRLEPFAASSPPGRATFLELFFDLVFVFALTRISARAFEELTHEGAMGQVGAAITSSGKTLLLLLALWAVWQGTAWTTSRYDPHRLALQAVVIIALVGSMLMGVAIPRAFSATGLMFAVAYVVTQVSRPLILAVALGPHPYRRLKVRMAVVFAVSGVLWIGGATLPTDGQVSLWTAALILEYGAARFGWPVPGLGRSTVSKWEIAGEHLAERYQQFFLVALGETILVAGFAYSAEPYGSGHAWAFGLAVATSIMLWRIYVQRAGQILGEAVVKARHPANIGRSAADTHLVMVVGLAATAVGYELIIEHPLKEIPGPWLAMVLGGPALFLLGRARFEYEVFARVSPSRWIAVLVLAAAAVPLLALPGVAATAVGVVVLAAVAVADVRRAHGAPPEAAAPPF